MEKTNSSASCRPTEKTVRPLGRIIDLPKIFDPRGNLTVAQQQREVPFDISRVYWTYDVPGGSHRGGHAHKHCREVVIAVSGSFTVTLDNTRQKRSFLLNHPYQGLLIETNVWRTLDDFSSGAVCLVLAEDPFDEDDYIRDYADYVKYLSQLPCPKGQNGSYAATKAMPGRSGTALPAAPDKPHSSSNGAIWTIIATAFKTTR